MPEAKPTGRRTGNTRREEILQEVSKCVLRDRQNYYGDAEDNFSDIALRWTNYLSRRGMTNFTITPQDVAVMMADLKIARAATSPDHLDNLIDGAGYFVCAGGISKKRTT